MKLNLIDIIFTVLFIFPIISGFIKGFRDIDTKYEFLRIEKDVMTLISVILGVLITSKTNIITGIIDKIKDNIAIFGNLYGITYQIIYIILVLIFIWLIYRLLIIITKLINNVTVEPLLTLIGNITRRGGIKRRLFGGIFSIPTSLVNVIIAAFIIKILTLMPIVNVINPYVNNSDIYEKLNDKLISPVSNSYIIKEFPKIVSDSFQIKVVEVADENNNSNKPIQNNKDKKSPKIKEIVYYNGVTLDHGIKSSPAIKAEALRITNGKNTEREKAEAIYRWIGTNIRYDDNKAAAVMNNKYKTDSGAIAAFNTKKGICFDFACLYVAMARDCGLPVKLITGEGYNGREWVPHAWNEVYLKDEKKWVKVDSTFYDAGNYFDTNGFNKDHKESSIAGEWN